MPREQRKAATTRPVFRSQTVAKIHKNISRTKKPVKRKKDSDSDTDSDPCKFSWWNRLSLSAHHPFVCSLPKSVPSCLSSSSAGLGWQTRVIRWSQNNPREITWTVGHARETKKTPDIKPVVYLSTKLKIPDSRWSTCHIQPTLRREDWLQQIWQRPAHRDVKNRWTRYHWIW